MEHVLQLFVDVLFHIFVLRSSLIGRNEFLSLIREHCCYSLSHLLTWVYTSKYQCIYALPSCILLQLVPTSVWTRIVYSNCYIYAFLSLIRVLNAVSIQLGFGYQSLRQIAFQLSTLSVYPWFVGFHVPLSDSFKISLV